MILIHDAITYCDIEAFLSKEDFSTYVVYVFMAPLAIFANWRSFFILLSGISNGYAFFKNMPSFKQLTIQTLVKTIVSALLAPFMIYLDGLWLFYWRQAGQIQKHSQTQSLFWAQKWYEFHSTRSTMGTFWAIAFIILPICNYILAIPFWFSRGSKQTKLIISLILSFAAGVLIMLTSNLVNVSLYRTFILQDKVDIKGNIECSVTNYRAETSNEYIVKIILNFVAGTNVPFTPLFGNLLIGVSWGILFVIICDKKKQLANDLQRWNRFRKYCILGIGLSFLIPLFFFAMQYIITTVDMKKEILVTTSSGETVTKLVRNYFQSYIYVLKNNFVAECYSPELLTIDCAIQFLMLFIAMCIFEISNQKIASIRMQRVSYLRRFGACSFTLLIFSLLLGAFVRQVFVYTYDPTSFFQELGLLLLQYVILHLIMLGAEKADFVLTPDWIFYLVGSLAQGKFKPNQYAEKQYLKVQPLTLLEKLQDTSVQDEEAQLVDNEQQFV